MRARMTTTVTCLDACDPYAPGGANRPDARGPTLRALDALPCARLVILETPATPDARPALERALRETHLNLAAEWIPLPLDDALPARLSETLTRASASGPLSVCVNSGPDIVRESWGHIAARHPKTRWIEVIPRADGSTGLREEKPNRSAHALNEPILEYAADTRAAPPPDLATACGRLGLRGEDPAFRAALDMAARLAPHPVPLLIHGETGTGKGMLAALIHQLSGRGRAPFVAVNCAALPETLVESILFGHRKGAFTGAAADQPGKFALADGGTLFLDEVGELPLALQAKLLRVLEDGVVEPIGATRGTPVDVRVIAATHRDLKQAVAERAFREDLFYRLGYAQLSLPPLRARRGDIKLLALHQLTLINRSIPSPRRLDASAIARLEQHTWPGNIRELANTIGRSALLCEKPILQAADMLIDPPPARTAAPSLLPDIGAGFSLESYLADLRRQLIHRALEQAGGNRSQAARLLGISPQAVHKHLRADPSST